MKKFILYQFRIIILVFVFVCYGTLPLSAQFELFKEAPATAKPGDQISFRITYRNVGTTIQKNVVIEDVLPVSGGDYEYLGSSPQGVYNPLTGKITWTKNEIPELGNLNSGEGVIHIYGKIGKKFTDALHYSGGYYLSNPPQEVFNNTATIQSDNVTTPLASNTTTTTVTQTCTANLSQAGGVVKSSSNSEIFYIVAVTNTGNIWNKWQISTTQQPAPYQQLNVSFYNLNGIPLNNNNTDWIQPGSTTMFLMKLVSPNGTNPSIGTPQNPNITTVTATPVVCGTPVSRDFTTEICGGNCPDYMYVSAYKLDIPDPVQSGSQLVYQMVIYNSLGSSVSDIKLTEIYPTLTSFISYTSPTNNGNAVPHTFTGNNQWNFSSLPAGMTTFLVTVKLNDNIPNNTSILNRLELTTPTYQSGTQPFSFYEESTLVLSAHDLWVNKTSDKTNAEPGDTITYTLNYGNEGNYQGDNVTVTDNFDENYMEVVDAGGATFNGGNLVWLTPGAMPIGYTTVKTYKLKIKDTIIFPEGVTNILNNVNIANHQNPIISFDPDYTDNQDNYRVFVENIPDLRVIKNADKIRAKPGQNLTYTITVSNTGDADHTGSNYTVTDYLPAGLNYVSSNPSGTYNVSTHSVNWTLSTPLNINATETFQLTVDGITQNMNGAVLTNEVSVYSANINDKDLGNNEFILQTPVEMNLWYGGLSSDWADGSNWTYGTVPSTGEDVVFASIHNYSSAAVRDLILDQDRTIGDLLNESDKALIIPVERTLIINGKATTGTADHLILKSQKNKANAALIFAQPQINQTVNATVEFASISRPSTGVWPRIWQFFGVPVKNKRLYELFGTNVQGSISGGDPAVNTIVRKYEEYLNDPQSYQEKWQNVTLNDIVVPFQGYEITQPQAMFDNADTNPYKFRGILNTDVNFVLPLTISSAQVYSRGNFMLANPYSAPIYIGNLQPADFVNLAPTIYIYNTGSRQDWLSNNGAAQAGDLPGTYSAIPINAATTIGKTQIPSMQAFLVKAITDNPSVADFIFRYATLNRGSITTPNEPMRVDRISSGQSVEMTNKEIKPLLTMDVIGENGSDRVYLITTEATGKHYDAGWDGYKTLSSDNVQLYAIDADNRRMQVNADNNLNDTYIGFRSGGESTYTLRFEFNNEMQGMYESIYIQDLATGVTQKITDGSFFSFVPVAGTSEKRFKLTGNRISTSVKPVQDNQAIQLNVSSDRIDLKNNTGGELIVSVYDLPGQIQMVTKVSSVMTSISHDLESGYYIFEACTPDKGIKSILKTFIKK